MGRSAGTAGRLARVALGACTLVAARGSAAAPGAERAVARPPLVPATAARILEAVREGGAGAVLVNVWATWCLPCREELPELLRLRREYASRGLRLILVSGDFPSERSQVERFLEELGIDFATYLKDGSDMEFINTLHASWSGALPATFLFDAGGTLRKFWEGRASYATLERGVVDAINDAPGRGDAKEPS